MNSLIPFTFNEYFTTNYVGKVQEVLLNIDYFIADPIRRVYQLLFTLSQTISMENWRNSKQNIRPKKGICSYLMNFYHVVDTIYTECTELFCASFWCPCVSSQWNFEMSFALGFCSWRYSLTRMQDGKVVVSSSNLKGNKSYWGFKLPRVKLQWMCEGNPWENWLWFKLAQSLS